MDAKREGKLFILSVLLVIMSAGVAQSKTWVDEWKQMYLSEEEKQLDSREDLAVTFTMAGVSEYIWRGFDMLDDRGAFQPSINGDWYGTGISTMVWSAIPVKEEIGNKHEMRYVVGYTDWLWEDTLHVTQYTVNWVYYDFTELPSTVRDAQEIGVQFSWPRAYMVRDSRFVPSYYVGRLWPAKSKAVNKDSGGWIHILGLDYEFWLFGAGVEKQIAFLSAELVYNDGMLGAENDWSDAVFGIGTTLRDGRWTVRPEFKYQVSLDDTVNDEDEYWGGMSISYQF